MRETTRDPSTLSRPAWNSLEKNYDLHDIGEQHIRHELAALGYRVEGWGIDKRHHDDALIFDDKMDLKVRDPDCGGRLVGIQEIKTKRRENWFGVMNLRHFKHYLDVAHEFEVPTFVYMTLVDDGTNDETDGRAAVDGDNARIVKDTFLPIKPWDEYQTALDDGFDFYDDAETFLDDQTPKHPQVEYIWQAPDGNMVVELDLKTGVSWGEMNYRIMEQSIGWAEGIDDALARQPWRT